MSSSSLSGLVQSGTGGLHPLPNALLAVYAVTGGTPAALASGRTDAKGWFSIDVPVPAGDTMFYVTADAGGGVVLMVVLGPDILSPVVINELTTVAAAYAFAQLAVGSTLHGAALPVRIAAGMAGNLVSPYYGLPSVVLQSPPNGDETVALRSVRALGNLLAPCVRGMAGAMEELLALTTRPGEGRPANTFEALVSLAKGPGHEVGALYQRTRELEIYVPALQEAPDAWTLAVKVNDSGDDAYLFGGPANVVFDDDGYAWVANNVQQGTPYSARCIMVLRPDGTPANGSGGEPRSPLFGGGIWGPGWGIDIDPTTGNVWVGNYGWGYKDNPPAGSVSAFRPDGTPLSGPDGYTNLVERVQAAKADGQGNIWMASYGNDLLVCYRGGDPNDALSANSGSMPFGIAIARDGSAWVTNGAGLGWPTANPSTVCRYSIDGDTLRQEMEVSAGFAAKVVVVDARHHGWVASCGDSKVYRISPDGTEIATYDGGGIDTPWGLALDGDDNVWVSSFGKLGPTEVFTTAALSVLAGDTEKNRQAGLRTGDPISPPTGYTLKSGGAPVTLHNGEPLYGAGSEPCFTPFMRSTSCQIDQAGNVWVVNNWKPDFGSDFLPVNGNPGGDGIVIFVGLAPPPVKPQPS